MRVQMHADATSVRLENEVCLEHQGKCVGKFGSGCRALKKCSSRFLRALQQNRAQSRLLLLTKEPIYV